MLEVVFSAPITEILEKDDQKLLYTKDGLRLFRVHDSKNVILKKSWLHEIDIENRRVVFAANIEFFAFIGRDKESVIGFMFSERINPERTKIIDLRTESILSIRDTETNEFIFQKEKPPA